MTNSLVILPTFTTISLPCDDLPENVSKSIAGVLAAESAWKEDVAAAWEGEMKFESKLEKIFILGAWVTMNSLGMLRI